MSNGKIVLGVLAGVAAGALLGILFAPDKGSVTRKKLTKKGAETADELKDQMDELMTSFHEKFEIVREKAAEITKKAQEASTR